MVMNTLVKLAVLTASATAASLPVRDTPATFRLSANVLRFDLTPSLQGQELSYTPGQVCKSSTFFVAAGQGATFRSADDTVGVEHFIPNDNSTASAGLIVTPGGTATVPSLNTVELQCDAGSEGLSVGADGLAYQGGAWMACPRDGVVMLSFKQAGQRTLLGCADVQLVAI